MANTVLPQVFSIRILPYCNMNENMLYSRMKDERNLNLKHGSSPKGLCKTLLLCSNVIIKINNRCGTMLLLDL